MASPNRPGKSLVLILLTAIMFSSSISPLNRAVADVSAGYDLLVIGPESYRMILQRFLDFKAAQGIKAKFFSIEWVDANATGQRIVERLHEFIAGEYRQSGIKYLLLVGTYEQVPTKYVYSPSDELGLADFNYKPSDWYYAVPDWNDSEVGLLGGNIPKIAVGRLPVRNEEELNLVVRKIIRVEADFQPGLLLILSDPGVSANSLLDALNPCRSACVNMTPAVLKPSLFNNVTYLVTITHGNTDALFTRTPDGELKVLLSSQDAGKTGSCAIHYMAACFAGALDLKGESLARVLITSGEGPVLVIASSRTESSDNPILSGFWEHFLNTGDVGCSFIAAVETYLLDAKMFSSTSPSFTSYNFYLNKAIYGDVSWRIKNPRGSTSGAGVSTGLRDPAGNRVEEFSNDNAAESTAILLGKNTVALQFFIAFLSCTLAAKRKPRNRHAICVL